MRGRKNPSYVSLPARLRKARKAAGLRLRTLSLLAGLSDATVRNIETEGCVPSIATIEKLANALKVSPQWLAFDEQEASEPTAWPRGPSIADRLAAVRHRMGLSLRALGEIAGLPGGTVHAVERGKYAPSVATVEKLAKALKMSPGILAFGESTASISSAPATETQTSEVRE